LRANNTTLDRLAPLVQRQLRLAAEFHALGLRISSAAVGALLDAPRSGFAATASVASEIGRGVDDGLNDRTKARSDVL
jgi:hypothetical protein